MAWAYVFIPSPLHRGAPRLLAGPPFPLQYTHNFLRSSDPISAEHSSYPAQSISPSITISTCASSSVVNQRSEETGWLCDDHLRFSDICCICVPVVPLSTRRHKKSQASPDSATAPDTDHGYGCVFELMDLRSWNNFHYIFAEHHCSHCKSFFYSAIYTHRSSVTAVTVLLALSIITCKYAVSSLIPNKQVQCDLCFGKRLIKKNVGVAAFPIV